MTDLILIGAAFMAASVTAGAAYNLSETAPRIPSADIGKHSSEIDRAQLVASFLTGASTVIIGGRTLSIQSESVKEECNTIAAHEFLKSAQGKLSINPVAVIDTKLCTVKPRVLEASASP